MKLTKKQIEEIKRMNDEGISVEKLSKKFKRSNPTIYYHIEPEQKRNAIKRALKYYYNLSKEEKLKISRKRYPYNKAYIKNRYHNDPEFRKRYINYVNESQKRRRLKALKTGNCSRCFKENDSKWKLCLKCREKRRKSAQLKGGK